MLMELINIEWRPEWRGFWTDPRAYISELAKFSSSLPEGARKFAVQPGHYDFSSPRCVKDLKLEGVPQKVEWGANLEIRFAPNKWKHEVGLTIEYIQVWRLEVDMSDEGASHDRLGTVLLDEILPIKGGCSHEISLNGGRVWITCADLKACWEAGVS
jgi:hypothetical protein